MKTKEDFLKGCEHDGSYIPVNEVKRLMDEYAEYYHKQKMAEIILNTLLNKIASDEAIKIEAQKYWQHSTDLLSIWFEKGALWFKSLLTNEE